MGSNEITVTITENELDMIIHALENYAATRGSKGMDTKAIYDLIAKLKEQS